MLCPSSAYAPGVSTSLILCVTSLMRLYKYIAGGKVQLGVRQEIIRRKLLSSAISSEQWASPLEEATRSMETES